MTIKVGLIGAGGIGNAHSNAYEQMTQARVSAVADIRLDNALKTALIHGAHAYSSVDEMLGKETLDMVDICTPSFTHKELAVMCANRGLHVLCEKPMAYSLQDARAMIEVAHKNDVFLMIAQVIRFWPEYVYLKKMYDEGMYGKLVQAWFSRVCGAPMWAWENWYVSPTRSGLAPLELHIHDVDYIHYLLGKPDYVHCSGVNQPEIYASFIKAQYFYDSLPGVLVEAEGGWWQGNLPFQATFRVVFERAVLSYDGDNLMIYEAQAEEPKKVDFSEEVQMGSSINLKNTGGVYNEIAYFVECVRSASPPSIITPEQSYLSLKLLLTEIKSAEIGKKMPV
jgi:predicted dehydrogenase